MKFLLTLGGTKYIVDEKKLEAFYSLLEGSEEFVSKWNRGENAGEDHFYTYHVFLPEVSINLKTHDVEMLPDKLYAVSKLAGKPQ
tara:strand:- start:3435 stop:3689 length:255 start_codon:yes stop_codon:yes gene_type:complete